MITPIPKPAPRPKKAPKPIRQLGKVGLARQRDRVAKLKAEPADYRGYRLCYLGSHWVEHVDLEHVKDASVRPDLRHVKSNHKWACNYHNLEKKRRGGI